MATFVKMAFLSPVVYYGANTRNTQHAYDQQIEKIKAPSASNMDWINKPTNLRSLSNHDYAINWLKINNRPYSSGWNKGSNSNQDGFCAPRSNLQKLDAKSEYNLDVESNYHIKSGTSMATPIVSGIAADLLAINPRLDVNSIRNILKQSSNVGKIDHLHAMMLAEESLQNPVKLTKPKPRVTRPQSFAQSLSATQPVAHRFADHNQAKAALKDCQQCNALVAGIKGNTVSIVPKQIMIQVSDDMAKHDFAALSSELNSRLAHNGAKYGHASIIVTGKISPRTFVASVVFVEDSKPVSSAKNDPVLAQSAALNSVYQNLPGSDGIELVEADIIYPAAFDQKKANNPRWQDSIMHPSGPGPRDPLRYEQWALNDVLSHGVGVDAAKAYRRIKGFSTPREAGIYVGVGDTGGGPHPDMEGIYLPGRRFDDSEYPETDVIDRSLTSSHGAHVAGTIAAITGNRIGTEGVTDTLILPAKVLSDRGTGSLIDIILGMRWMAGLDIDGNTFTKTPARVINLSLGFKDNCSKFLQDTIDEAAEKGVVIVVAAGNANTDAAQSCPANCKNVITVGAVDRTGQRVRFSNYGTDIDIYAPGVDILAPTHTFIERAEPDEPPIE